MQFSKFLSWAVGAAVLAVAVPASAEAACTQSTSSTQAFADAAGDDQGGLAPDISSVVMTVDSACRVGGTVNLFDGSTDMIYGEAAAQYVDVDGSFGTGSPVFEGADRVIMTLGATGADSLPGVGVWNPVTSQFDFSGIKADEVTSGVNGWAWGIDQLGVLPATIRVTGATLYNGLYNSYADFSPEPSAVGGHSFPVGYSTIAAPVAPTPSTTTTTQEPAAPTETTPAFVCKPGSLRGLKLGVARQKALSRGCDVKVRFKKVKRGRTGRVLSTRTSGSAVTLFISKRSVRARRSSTDTGFHSYAEVLDVLNTVASGRR
jgi:hypothetical protein